MSLKDALINAAPDFIVKVFAAPYVAGDSEQAAAFVARELWSERNIESTVDLLGEELTRSEDVEATVESYQRVVDALGEQPFATISCKPTQLGSHESTDVCAKNIARVARYAQASHIPTTIDMEDHPYTDMTLEIYKRLLPEFPDLGTVLQTRLHRTDEDIKSLKGLKTRIRLCIGIYLEPAEIALTKKPQMKERLMVQGEQLLDEGHYVEFGTHDERLIARILDMTTKRGFSKKQFEIQMLLGVPREKLQQQLIADEYVVRLYVPYAIEWRFATGYSKRRLASNPNMGLYVAQNLFRQLLRRR
jgi:proline dehydrogenase